MIRFHSILLGAVLATGCVASHSDELEPTTAATGEPESTGSAPALMICGENTIASARAPNGNRVMFCVHEGLEVIAEGGREESSVMLVPGACAVDTFMALTGDTVPVPRALVESCAALTGVEPSVTRSIVDARVFEALPEDDVRDRDTSESYGGSYC